MKKFLVIGSGSIARRHISNLRQLYPLDEIGCVSSSGRIVELGETNATVLLGSIEAAASWKPMFVVVASPAPFHLEHALVFLRLGIPVLIEKPISDSVLRLAQDNDELIKYSSLIEVSYNLRFLSSATRMKQLIEGNKVGTLHSISIDLGQYLPDWRPQDDYRKNVSAQSSLGGGVLLELSHELDYLSWIFGKFDAVFGIISNSGSLEIDVEDRADIMFSRTDGLVAHLHLDFLQRRATRRCKVVGETGNLVWNLLENTIQLETKDGCEILFDERNVDRNDMYLKQLQHFSEVATGKSIPLVGFSAASYTLKLVFAIRMSSNSRETISIREI